MIYFFQIKVRRFIIKYNQRIKDLREDSDKIQKENAELLKKKTSYYGKYEWGVHSLPIKHLITLCKYYSVSADYIPGFIDEPIPL